MRGASSDRDPQTTDISVSMDVESTSQSIVRGTWMAIRTVLGNPDGYGRGEGDGGACSEWEHGQATGRSRTPDTADPDTFGGVPKRMRN